MWPHPRHQQITYHLRHVILQGVQTDLVQRLKGHGHVGCGFVEQHLGDECDTNDVQQEGKSNTC